jgi:heptosyltransferase-2
MKTLVVLPNWVGDTVMALPVLQALASTNRQLAVTTRPHLAPLLAPLPWVAEVVPAASSLAESAESIRQRRFAEAVILPNSFRSSWLPLRAGIPRRWGYRGRNLEGWLRAFCLQPAVAAPRRRDRHQVEDYRELLLAMGIAPPADWTPRLEASPEQRPLASALLGRARIDERRSPIIGLSAGAEYGASKRWPWQRFAELARDLRRQVPGSQTMILAGPKEAWTAVRIHEESGKIHPVVGPDLDLKQLAAVLARLDLLVTNDSGPMHLAAALGVPCVALFGPTDPHRTRPVGDRHQVLYTDRWCSPCFRRRCPLMHHRCLRDITVSEVVDRALTALARIPHAQGSSPETRGT